PLEGPRRPNARHLHDGLSRSQAAGAGDGRRRAWFPAQALSRAIADRLRQVGSASLDDPIRRYRFSTHSVQWRWRRPSPYAERGAAAMARRDSTGDGGMLADDSADAIACNVGRARRLLAAILALGLAVPADAQTCNTLTGGVNCGGSALGEAAGLRS